MGEGAQHHLRWDRCDVDEVRFAFFPVPRYEVLCFRGLLVYSHVACCLVAPGGRFFGCDLTACYFCCLIPHSLIFPYDDYFRRVAVGNEDALVRQFEAWFASFASPGAGGGVVAADLDPFQKYICCQRYSWWVSHSVRGAPWCFAPCDSHFPRSDPLRVHYYVRKRTCQPCARLPVEPGPASGWTA